MEKKTPESSGAEQALAPEQAPAEAPIMTEAPKKHHFVAWIIVLVVGIAVIAAAGFYLVDSSKETAPSDVMVKDDAAMMDKDGAAMEAEAEVEVTDNPFEDVDTNPVEEDADNPFDDADYNPFN